MRLVQVQDLHGPQEDIFSLFKIEMTLVKVIYVNTYLFREVHKTPFLSNVKTRRDMSSNYNCLLKKLNFNNLNLFIDVTFLSKGSFNNYVEQIVSNFDKAM